MTTTGKQSFLRQALFICLLLMLQLNVFAQSGSLKGLIRNEKGDPIASANVSLTNAATKFKQRVTTDSTGMFRFAQVPAGSGYTIEVSHIGYATQTLPNYTLKEGEPVAVSIKMKENNGALNEIVIVGYGSRSKSEITGSITSVKREDFNQGVYSSPLQLLQGKVAGLNITKSGNPNENPTVVLRGPSSFRPGNDAYEPFYVIDGVPGANINTIAPDDIESIDVLKDASSTSIYGARAANGVIIITSRKVRKGQSRLSYSSYIGIEKISHTLKMADANQLRNYVESNGDKFDAVNNDSVSNTNWQKEISRTGLSHNHNVSFNGSNQHSSYGVSVNYLNNEGIIKGSSMNRFVVRANVEHRAFNDRLRLSLNVTNSRTNGDLIPSQVYNNMMTYLPTVAVKQADGSYTEDRSRTVGTGGYYNPVALIANNTIQNKINLSIINGVINANILPGLDFTTSIAFQNQQQDTNQYYNRYSMLDQIHTGFASRSTTSSSKKIWESYATYNTSFNRHNIKLLGGYSWQEDRDGDGFYNSNYNFASDDYLWYNLGLGTGNLATYSNTAMSVLRLISFYGRAGYDFDGKYLFQATLRRDGSSAFGTNQQWGYFPAVSAGWNIHREDFMRDVHFINALKLRVGYGVSGNSSGFNAFTAKSLYGSGTSYFYYGGQWINNLTQIQSQNPDLKWERTATYNAGIDFSILNNKISGSLDVYQKETSDLIGTYAVPTSIYPSGYLTANVGKMRNRGIELALNATPIKNGKFSWTTSVTLAHNVNVIQAISNDQLHQAQIYTANNVAGRGQTGASGYQIIVPGQALGTFYTLQYAGKDANGQSTFYGNDGTASKDSTLNGNFAVYQHGSAQPKLLYGWNNTFRYGHFDLNFFLRGVMGNKILNATRADMNAPIYAKLTNVLASTTTEENYKDATAHFISDRYIESGSFLRLDNATLGYTFTTRQNYNLRLFVSGNNLFIITKYKGVDPEVNMAGQTPGIDYRNFYPKTRSFQLGVNVVF
ncbi:iron complex outermembrane recepter protein [Filimonas lacunae]|uniref:Iron complex outermembrane recepter protein n=1 Tax=Filimonas lacunae TaxID=477680 RepID=A0A173MK26_9BACT|nr:SusC/RagA family TonB-linked outer membrane protein [Filimonas lacunae]BAV07827.1 outer membrane protein SusC, starch binding [Filimonas lacunae]SIT05296.1 iron complex outermembrane recepter protein [Filimonas lacunae]